MKTVIETYSLAQGEVGKPVGDAIIESHGDGVAALRALNQAIDSHLRTPGHGLRFQIELPDGRRVSFDEAYTEVFGERPVKRDNLGSLYPRLKAAKASPSRL